MLRLYNAKVSPVGWAAKRRCPPKAIATIKPLPTILTYQLILYCFHQNNILINLYHVSLEDIMGSQIAKIFMNGRSQAVRLPKEFRFDTDEVYITKQGENIILSAKQTTWDDFFDYKSAFDDDFFKDRLDTLPQERGFY